VFTFNLSEFSKMLFFISTFANGTAVIHLLIHAIYA
jgi:hypothetical protein